MTKNDLITDKRYRADPSEFRAGLIERARGGDGYDVIHAATTGEDAWRVLASWGRDGWDLGSWPLVIVFFRRKPSINGFAYQVAYYVEGDVAVYEFPTITLATNAIDALAFFHWQHDGEPWVEGIESADQMPARLCGPYSENRVS